MSIHFGNQDTGLCDRNLNLLAHAQSIELDIGSVCGGHGNCGKDRVRIKSDDQRALLSLPTAEEREHLSEAEFGDGWRLACQCYPERNDLEIHVDTR